MNLIDAVKSGRPFKRSGSEHWRRRSEKGGEFENDWGSLANGFRPSDILADDWEIQDLEVRVTRTQFNKAVREIFGWDLGSGIIQYVGKTPPPVGQIAALAHRLGLAE